MRLVYTVLSLLTKVDRHSLDKKKHPRTAVGDTPHTLVDDQGS